MAMATRNTARRVLRSDTAAAAARRTLEIENGGGDGSTPETRLNQLQATITGMRQEMTASQESLRLEVTATLANLGDNIAAEMLELQGHLANLVQGMTNMSTTLSQTHTMAQSAQEMAAEARAHAAQRPTQSNSGGVSQQGIASPSAPAPSAHDVVMASPAPGHAATAQQQAHEPHLRKMDVKPPQFDGYIDGIKLNSFIFQFENYYKKKGYNLVQHDDSVCEEMNQCVRKNAVDWYERYMTDPSTVKLWSAMKTEMMKEFREPNFEEKVRNQLLTIRQTGGYLGYVTQIRKLQGVVRLDELSAVNIFMNGLANASIRMAVKRKQPKTLEAAIAEGFRESSVQEVPAAKQSDTAGGNKGRGNDTKANRSDQSAKTNSSAGKKPPASARGKKAAAVVCSHCGKGYHREDDCWIKHPEKKPANLQKKQQLHQQIFALLESLVVDEEHKAGSPPAPDQSN